MGGVKMGSSAPVPHFPPSWVQGKLDEEESPAGVPQP